MMWILFKTFHTELVDLQDVCFVLQWVVRKHTYWTNNRAALPLFFGGVLAAAADNKTISCTHTHSICAWVCWDRDSVDRVAGIHLADL